MLAADKRAYSKVVKEVKADELKDEHLEQIVNAGKRLGYQSSGWTKPVLYEKSIIDKKLSREEHRERMFQLQIKSFREREHSLDGQPTFKPTGFPTLMWREHLARVVHEVYTQVPSFHPTRGPTLPPSTPPTAAPTAAPTTSTPTAAPTSRPTAPAPIGKRLRSTMSNDDDLARANGDDDVLKTAAAP